VTVGSTAELARLIQLQQQAAALQGLAAAAAAAQHKRRLAAVTVDGAESSPALDLSRSPPARPVPHPLPFLLPPPPHDGVARPLFPVTSVGSKDALWSLQRAASTVAGVLPRPDWPMPAAVVRPVIIAESVAAHKENSGAAKGKRNSSDHSDGDDHALDMQHQQQMTGHHQPSPPRKLVRGQDVWLGKGQEQTRQILKCMWCGESYKSLAELTTHMRETKHYTKVISQEQISSWRNEYADEGDQIKEVRPFEKLH
jgi:hypothetical protein